MSCMEISVRVSSVDISEEDDSCNGVMVSEKAVSNIVLSCPAGGAMSSGVVSCDGTHSLNNVTCTSCKNMNL